MNEWEYEVSGYYGPGGRKGNRKNPYRGRPGEREGELAAAVGCNGQGTVAAEVAAFKAREDIGEIVVTGTDGFALRRRSDGTWPDASATQ